MITTWLFIRFKKKKSWFKRLLVVSFLFLMRIERLSKATLWNILDSYTRITLLLLMLFLKKLFWLDLIWALSQLSFPTMIFIYWLNHLKTNLNFLTLFSFGISKMDSLNKTSFVPRTTLIVLVSPMTLNTYLLLLFYINKKKSINCLMSMSYPKWL